jgi:17beta-estradiol 17-dehydrogenase / very-long-chain 3-oxoacyl-CoA reductase
MIDLWTFVVYVGALRAAYLILQAVYFNYLCKLDINTYKYGWVVITGSSDGIGKAISEDLAGRGFKLILISRSEEKLSKLVQSLKSKYKTEDIDYIPCDFKYSHRNPEEFYGNLMKRLDKYEISALINNVGVLEFNNLADQSLDSIETHLGVNIYPQTMLSYHILPKFIKRFEETKQRSLLVNFSSTIDLITMPTTSVYSATKRYAEFLSEGIRLEYSSKVDVVTVKPGGVATNMTSAEHGNGLDILPMTAEVNSYAQYLINHLHKGINYGHWKHSIMVFTLTLLPHQIMTFLIKHSMFLLDWATKKKAKNS